MTTQTISKEMQQCIEACRECQKCCVALETECLKSGGVDSSTIQMAKDCFEMCQMCSNFVMRESHFAVDICKLCAEVCKECAAACDKMSRSSFAKECAVACRRCAATCMNVSSPVHA